MKDAERTAELEAVEVVAFVKHDSPLPGYTDFMKYEPWMDGGLSPGWIPLMTVAQHHRIMASQQRTQAAGVPDEKPLPDLMMSSYHEAIGWNAYRKALLAAPAQPAAQDQGEVQRLRDHIPLYEAVERACGELPNGWTIQLHMENGAGWVELYDDSGCQVDDFPTNNERLDYTLNDAIDAALASSAEQDEHHEEQTHGHDN